MFLFLITSFSFLFLYKSLPLRPIPPWAYEMRLLSLWFWRDFSFFPIAKSIRNIMSCSLAQFPSKLSLKKNNFSSNVENVEMTLLDLPELILETILLRLPPDGLCSMAGVCLSLRDRCTSDHLWERHLTQKWGIVIGPSARREWQWHVASRKDSSFLEGGRGSGFISFLSQHWPLSLIRSTLHSSSKRKLSSPVDSIMSWYLALESGKFWFPAQVYNRENGHVGFMLSCYDAYLSYDPTTDTFKAKYPPHGRKAIAMEKGVSWDRIRAPPVDTSPHDLYISDCLNELQPGDHVEIQWRRNKEFPYGWWYGVVGHLELCDGNDNYCHCRDSDSVVLEFNQYAPGSQWRHASISRKDHREEGNEADGFYGGIRKLYSNREISTWRRLWPAEILE